GPLTKNEVVVSGAISLQGCVQPVQLVTFEFRPLDGKPSFRQTFTLDGDGAFALGQIPADRYQVAIKGSKWLRKVVEVNALEGDVSGVAATLLAGDCNDDNRADVDDLGILALAFNSRPGDLMWDSRADLNCDGAVDLSDLGLLALNFNTEGDP